MAYQTIAALSVLADPTRCALFEELARRPRAVGELAAGLPISRPAVSQHLKILKAAGLVTDHAMGNRRIYRIDPTGLGPLRRWLDQLWDEALQSFQEAAEADAAATKE
jgi:DNA-binding transcriptional ArsR family regulator